MRDSNSRRPACKQRRPSTINHFYLWLYDAVRDKAGENKQLFQVISVDGNKLSYKSYTAIGDLFDSFDLIKNENGINSLINE